MKNIFCIFSGVISGILGSMGLGGGGILIIYLTLLAGIEQTKAQGINLIFYAPCAIISTVFYAKRRIISWKLIFPLSFLGIIGSYFGTIFASNLSSSALKKIFGMLLIIISLKEFIKKK